VIICIDYYKNIRTLYHEEEDVMNRGNTSVTVDQIHKSRSASCYTYKHLSKSLYQESVSRSLQHQLYFSNKNIHVIIKKANQSAQVTSRETLFMKKRERERKKESSSVELK
jgi:hypothetical protein